MLVLPVFISALQKLESKDIDYSPNSDTYYLIFTTFSSLGLSVFIL